MRGSATCSVTEKREVDECSDHRCEYASEPDSDSEDSTAAACYIDPRGLNLALADLYIRQIYDFKLVLSDSVSTTSAAGNSRFTAIVDQWEQYRWRGNEQLQPKFIAWSTASID